MKANDSFSRGELLMLQYLENAGECRRARFVRAAVDILDGMTAEAAAQKSNRSFVKAARNNSESTPLKNSILSRYSRRLPPRQRIELDAVAASLLIAAGSKSFEPLDGAFRRKLLICGHRLQRDVADSTSFERYIAERRALGRKSSRDAPRFGLLLGEHDAERFASLSA